MKLTCIPKRFWNWIQGFSFKFRKNHDLTLTWMVLCQMICPGKITIAALARLSANHMDEWSFRRLLAAKYWDFRQLTWQFAERALKSLPGPQDGTYYLILDSTLKGKCGKKHPLAKKGKLNKYSRYIFGIHIVFAVLHWGNYRIVVDFEIVKPKDDPNYSNENTLARWMIIRFRPPKDAKKIIVVADAAFASKENFKVIRQRGYYYVFAVARTWKTEEGKSLKNLAAHLKHCLYRKTWVPLNRQGHRQVFWTYSKRIPLRELGDVTIVLSKKRRNLGPKKVKIMVTNLPNPTVRKVVEIYKRRWWIEVMIKELKGAVGLGQHQVTREPNRVEKSVAIAVAASLALINFRAEDIPPEGPWSLFQLKHNFTLEVVKDQVERSVSQRLRKEFKKRVSA